jgi:histone deacetylase 11
VHAANPAPFTSATLQISFFGLEKLHPFDACKFRKVVAGLQQAHLSAHQPGTGAPPPVPLQLAAPADALSWDALADVHNTEYLKQLRTTTHRVVQVTELAALSLLPPALLQWRVVTPMRYHAAGTMLATALAVERGWAVNIGGGMHHAHHAGGGGWCPFDDVTLAVRRLAAAAAAAGSRLRRVIYIDLDAHQGNGVSRDKARFFSTATATDCNAALATTAAAAAAAVAAPPPPELVILDAFHDGIYPADDEARAHVDFPVPLRRGCGDAAYLSALQTALDAVAARCGYDATSQVPQQQQEGVGLATDVDLVFYNAGTDVLEGDPLGRLGVSAGGVEARDAAVWAWARDVARAPLVMTLSGGYTPASAGVITSSLAKLVLPAVGGSGGN